MIRLIATDLDDTLLDQRSAVSPRSLAALRRAMDAGCRIALSSGRMLESTLPYARQIGVNAPMLLYNGGMIYDPAAGRAVYAEPIRYETALAIVERMEDEGFYIQLYPGEGYYCSAVNDFTRAYAASIRVPAIPTGIPMARWLRENPSDMLKLLVIDTPEGATRAQEILREAFPRDARCLKSRPHYVEITPEGVDKGRALERLAEYLGVAREEVMAFGDGENDVPMLTWAGEGWAVGNACPEALRRAGRIAPRNTQDGVAQIIERYLEEGLLGG